MRRAKNLPGVNVTRKRLASGEVRVYHYHRATGLRLPGTDATDPEYLTAYANAESATRRRTTRTLAGLIRDYTASSRFADLARSTRTDYLRHLAAIEAEHGHMSFAVLDDPAVRVHFDTFAEEIAQASGARTSDLRMSVLSSLLTWGVKERLLITNHALGFTRLYSNDRKDIVWTPEHIEAFMRAAPPELQRVVMMALHTGARQGDLRRLVWSNYDGTALRFKISKNTRKGKAVRDHVIPCTAALRAMLDNTPRTAAVILATSSGNAWSKSNLGKRWRATMREAGLAELGLHFHDLRGTTITILAEEGLSVPQIAAITGHSLEYSQRVVDAYLARTGRLAEAGIEVLNRSTTLGVANRLQTKPTT